MIGRNMMKPMTKEDLQQLQNVNKFLVPLKTLREQQDLKPKLEEMKVDDDSKLDTAILEQRKSEREMEDEMSKKLVSNAIKDCIKYRTTRK
jgi:hypothetical protein